MSPPKFQEYPKILTTNSRTNAFDSFDSTPSSSRRVSLEGENTDRDLPSRLSIIDGIYRKLKKHLEIEIRQRSTSGCLPNITPGKSVLCVGSGKLFSF